VDEELRAPSEEVCQGDVPLVGIESILLVDPNPRQLLPPPRQFVVAPRELLLRLEQLEPRCEPLFTCPGHVLRHRSSLLPSGVLGVPGLPSNCLAGASVFAPMDVLPRKRSRGPGSSPQPFDLLGQNAGEVLPALLVAAAHLVVG